MNASADYPLEHVLALTAAVSARGLNAPPGFRLAPPEVLTELYNGLGPDRFPRPLRRLLTAVLARYEPAALIHDWEYVFSPKTRAAFLRANLRFACNCVLAVPGGGARAAVEAAAMALACQLFGWRGYLHATMPENKETAL